MGIELVKNNDLLTLGAQRVRAVEEVWVGAEAPTEDKGYKVWVNPEENELAEIATKGYVNEAVKNVEVDLSGYATTDYVNSAIGNIVIPEVDLTGYATEEYVNSAIGNIVIPEVDLSGYALKSEIPDVSAYQTEAQVIALIEAHGGGGEVLPAAEGVEF